MMHFSLPPCSQQHCFQLHSSTGRLFLVVSNLFSAIFLALFLALFCQQALAADQSQAMAQFAPSAMEAGKEYSVMIQFKNTGNTTWGGSNYMLGSKNPSNNKFWGTSRVRLSADDSIKPGDTLTVKFFVTAPLKAGDYNFQWQMFRQGSGWFGQKTPSIKIPVEGRGDKNKADFVLQEIPGLVKVGPPYTVLNVGQNFSVKVIVKNTGTSTWTWGKYKLVAQKPAKNLTWLIDQVNLNNRELVRPGEFKTFTFNAVVPTKPGIYDFQWQMYEEGIGFFGTTTPNVKITVLK